MVNDRSAERQDSSNVEPVLRPPRVAFLGICDRVDSVRDGDSSVFKVGIIGLRQVLSSHIYPLFATRVNVVLAIFEPGDHPPFVLRLVDSAAKEVLAVNLELVRGAEYDVPHSATEPAAEMGSPTSAEGTAGIPQWAVVVMPVESPPLAIADPGTYKLILSTPNSDEVIGALHCIHVVPPPLTPDRIAAIKSDPAAGKTLSLMVQCRTCGDRLRVYVGLERDSDLEQQGFQWYNELPSKFLCRCAKVSIPLEIIRRDFHGLLGKVTVSEGGLSVTPEYKTEMLQAAARGYQALIEADVDEEVLQKFLEAHPYFLHQFSPAQLFFKAPILSSFKTDFAIVNGQRELVLVEIERATLKLHKADGGQAAELTRAFDQVHAWLDVLLHHRLAVLDDIGIPYKAVQQVRGVVIAGRDKDCDAEYLRRLKSVDRPVKLLTHDDLLRSVVSLIRTTS